MGIKYHVFAGNSSREEGRDAVARRVLLSKGQRFLQEPTQAQVSPLLLGIKRMGGGRGARPAAP